MGVAESLAGADLDADSRTVRRRNHSGDRGKVERSALPPKTDRGTAGDVARTVG